MSITYSLTVCKGGSQSTDKVITKSSDPTYFEGVGYVSLTYVAFVRKIYSPNELIADIQVQSTSTTFASLQTAFEGKAVKFQVTDGTNTQTFEKLYVHHIIPLRNGSSTLYVRLKIYSYDYQLTTKQYCRTYVGKRLGSDILQETFKDADDVSKNYINEKLCYSDRPLTVNVNLPLQHNMDGQNEMTLPYLVQYNESFYDFISRTANRCGEFLYFEDGKLNYGVADSDLNLTFDSNKCVAIYGKKLTHVDNNYYSGNFNSFPWAKKGEDLADDDKWETNWQPSEGSYGLERNISDDELKYNFEVNEDEYHTRVFKNKFSNVKTMSPSAQARGVRIASNILTENSLYNMAKKVAVVELKDLITTKAKSKDLQAAWVKDVYEPMSKKLANSSLQKNREESITPFTSQNNLQDSKSYQKIRKGELEASESAITIDLGTNILPFKLGQTISYEDKEYVIVQILLKPGMDTNRFTIADEDDPQDIANMRGSYMKIVVVPIVGSDIYPPMHPKGHVRHADAQVAFVSANGFMDPLQQGRIRIRYPWEKSDAVPSPWLKVVVPSASPDSGFYAEASNGDEVLVCYEGGNVERPYIGGFLRNRKRMWSFKRGDMYMISKNLHGITFNDPVDSTTFFQGMSPLFKTLKTYVTAGGLQSTILGGGFEGLADEEKDPEGYKKQLDSRPELLKLAGGITLRDAYGIYSINMSTDQRKIDISSPFGKVGINAFTGITISAPNGDISIKGKNVSIEAGNKVSIVSGKNIPDGSLWQGKFKANNWAGLMVGDLMSEVFKEFTPVDLDVLRCVFEMILRPIGGTMQIKSNNYLLLEAGKGSATIRPDKYKKMPQDVKKAQKDYEEKKQTKVEAIYHLIRRTKAYVKDYQDSLSANLLFFEVALTVYNNNRLAEINAKNVEPDCITGEAIVNAAKGKTPNEIKYKDSTHEDYNKLKFTKEFWLVGKIKNDTLKNSAQVLGEAACKVFAFEQYQLDLPLPDVHFNAQIGTEFNKQVKEFFKDNKDKLAKGEFTNDVMEKYPLKYLIVSGVLEALKNDDRCLITAEKKFTKNSSWMDYVKGLSIKKEPEKEFSWSEVGKGVEKSAMDACKPFIQLADWVRYRDLWNDKGHGQIIYSENAQNSYYFDSHGVYHEYLNGSNEELMLQLAAF